ncbi:MAG: hypothetical protein E7447_00485 [Ruminococcaceae bacterium]|nr:hypothetical protein [Oscillospiraceae bacterium]
MPLTYTDAYLNCSGPLSVIPFELAGDGRRLFFNCPGGTLRKDIFTVIDGKLNETPFQNGSRMETPIRGLERLSPNPHEAYAIVVDREVFPIGSISLANRKAIPVVFDDGQKACITLTGTVRASACITDPCALVKDYLQTGMQSPEATISAALEECLLDNYPTTVSSALRQADPHDALGMVDTIALELGKEIARQTQKQLDWMRITDCKVQLEIANMEEVVQKSNTLYLERKQMREKIMGVLLETYGKSPIPGEMVQLIVSYVQTHPNDDHTKLLGICTELKNLCQLHSPATIFQHCQRLGYLGGP